MNGDQHEQTQRRSSQIPAEVLARARKSGADVPVPTWYAGRLEVDGSLAGKRSGNHSGNGPAARLSDAELAAIVEAHRPHPVRDTTSNGIARMQQLWVALMSRLGAARTQRRPV